jgi:hypothetical protein
MSYGGMTFPDLDVQDVIAGAIEDLLANGTYLDRLFASRPAAERDSFKTALRNNEGRVRLDWQRDAAEDWTVHIILASSGAMVMGGGITSPEYEEAFVVTGNPGTLDADITAADGVVLSLAGGIPAGLPPRGRVRLGDEVSVYEIGGGPAEILLTHRGVVSTVAAPHATGSSAVFHRLNRRIGYPEEITLNVAITALQPKMAIILTRLLAGALHRARGEFENRGYTLAKVMATDLGLRPNDWPAEFRTRTLNVQLFTELSVPEELDIVADIDITLNPTDPPVDGSFVTHVYNLEQPGALDG